jgi:hypothetical protein
MKTTIITSLWEILFGKEPPVNLKAPGRKTVPGAFLHRCFL